MTFGNGMILREPNIAVNDELRRVAWSAIGGGLNHDNASAQVLVKSRNLTTILWIADLLPHEAAGKVAHMMDQGAAAMKATLDRLAEKQRGCLRV